MARQSLPLEPYLWLSLASHSTAQTENRVPAPVETLGMVTAALSPFQALPVFLPPRVVFRTGKEEEIRAPSGSDPLVPDASLVSPCGRKVRNTLTPPGAQHVCVYVCVLCSRSVHVYNVCGHMYLDVCASMSCTLVEGSVGVLCMRISVHAVLGVSVWYAHMHTRVDMCLYVW